MVTLTDSLVSSSARGMPIRMRPDLSARKQHYLGKSYWVVKEPVGLNYYRFQEEEYAILKMLDGHTSLDEIKQRFEAEFPPQKITLEELQQFLGMLHRSGLVVADVGGQGHQLRKRRDERRRKEILGALSNILCIRFKGIDPDRFLNWLYPKVRWLFRPAVLVGGAVLALCALTLVLVQFDVFRSRLPDFYSFFSFYNALWLLATLGVIKVVHELGHGLTCKHFGGECHEIGIMILVLTPCLYCNVSDSWMLPNKWHRALIGAMGIIVEVTMASVATFLWWFTEPGTFWNNLFLNVMFVASVSTVLFNGNPLLRYDGYYVLADLAEIPNLRQKATMILSRKLGHWCLGLEPPEDPFLPQRNQIFFALYSVAAATYRWFILASIMWFLFQVFKPYHLEIIGQAIVLMSLVGLVVMPLYKVGKFFYVPGRLEKVKKPRMYTSLGILTAVLLAVILVPLPHSVLCTFEIQPRDAERMYVNVTDGGRLEEVNVRPGQQVRARTELARLTNLDLETEIIRLGGERDQYQTQLDNANQSWLVDDIPAPQIPAIKAQLKDVEERLALKRKEQDRLRLVTPVDGTVLPPPNMPERPAADGQLSSWSGTPLDRENLGCPLDYGVLFCLVGDPTKKEAILVIDQVDIEFVREAQIVELKLDELPHDTLTDYATEDKKGNPLRKTLTITEIARADLKIAPTGIATAAGGELPTETDPATGAQRPQSTSYQARVPIEDPEGLLRSGLRGSAKIHTDPQSLGRRLWRFVSHTFKFKL